VYFLKLILKKKENQSLLYSVGPGKRGRQKIVMQFWSRSATLKQQVLLTMSVGRFIKDIARRSWTTSAAALKDEKERGALCFLWCWPGRQR
jgi:hypothetical protein